MTTETSDDAPEATVQEQSARANSTDADTPVCETTEGSESSKPGAPLGNVNAQRHGLRSSMLPPGCEYVRRQLATFRGALERAVLDERGRIDVYEAALVQTATEHTKHGLLCRRWLRVAFEELSHGERLAYSREIGRSFDARDRVLKQLGLDQQQRDTITVLYQGDDDGDDPE